MCFYELLGDEFYPPGLLIFNFLYVKDNDDLKTNFVSNICSFLCTSKLYSSRNVDSAESDSKPCNTHGAGLKFGIGDSLRSFARHLLDYYTGSLREHGY